MFVVDVKDGQRQFTCSCQQSEMERNDYDI